ncbi:Hypothetical predicted protein, partial [Olea europaea subsp. europaea]
MVKLKLSSKILRWTSPGAKLSSSLQLSSSSARPTTQSSGTTAKRWVHDEHMLVGGHVAYLVKFLGNIAVDQPK